MVKVSETYCDIKDCPNVSYKDDLRLPVVFTTEQTEGKSSAPYIDMCELDLCKEHYNDFLFTSPLTAIGAQGHNEYRLDVKLNRHSFEGESNNEPA